MNMYRRLVYLLCFLFFIPSSFLTAEQETPPSPAQPRPIHLPAPAEKTLANGLRVIVAHLPNMPLVTAMLMIQNGSEMDPSNLAGLAEMTASLLTKGTTQKTAPQIAQEIEFLGGTISASAGWDNSGVSTNVMSPNISKAMAILSDVVQNPAFRKEEIERLRQQNLDALRVALGQPSNVARFIVPLAIFPGLPYGHPRGGTPESLARIQRDEIVKLHQTYYRPDNAVLIFGGDISPEHGFELASQFFGDWKKPDTPLPKMTAHKPALASSAASNEPRVLVVDMPDAGQAAVMLARPAIRRSDPSYYGALVANAVLGGGYSARLNQEVRIKRGLSYGAGSMIDVRREIGPFLASSQTKNESADEVAVLFLQELKKLSETPVSETESTPRKASLIGEFGRTLQTTDGVVEAFAELASQEINLSEVNQFVQNIQSVTVQELQNFANATLTPSGSTMIIVGNAKEFIEDLKKNFKDVTVISMEQLDLNTPELMRKPSS